MASVWKHPESKYWFACFKLPNGKRTKRSTKRTSRSEAMKIAEKFEEAARNVATEVQARKVLADIYVITTGRNLKSTNIGDFLTRWAASKQNELSSSTGAKYKRVVEQFISHIGARVEVDLSHLEKDDIAGFRDSIASSRSAGTANTALKIIRTAFGQAKRDGLLAAKRFAVIADEAHSSQTGAAAAKLKAVLSPEEIKALEDGGEVSTEDLLAAQMTARAAESGITYPPDLPDTTTQTVLAQAELLCANWA